MATGSNVLVKLQIIGATLAAADAKKLGKALYQLEGSATAAGRGLGRTAAGGTAATGALGRVQAATRGARAGLVGMRGAGLALYGTLKRVGSVVGLGAGFGLYSAIKGTIEFDKQMRNVNSIAQLSEKRFQSLRKQVLALAGPTAQAPTTLAAGLYTVASAGYKGADALNILKTGAYAATAGLTTSDVAIGAVITALDAYRLNANKAGKISDILFETVNRGVITFPELANSIGTVLPIAAGLHVGLGQLGAAISTMTKEGLNGDETMTRLRALFVSFLKPSSDLKKVFRELGAKDGEALIKKFHGLQGAIEAVVGAVHGNKSAIAALLPNQRALQGALALTGINANAARDDLTAFHHVTGATQLALSQQSKSLSYQWNRLKANASALGITVGSKLIPPLASLVGAINGATSGGGVISDFFKGLTTGRSGSVVGPNAGTVVPGSKSQQAGAKTIQILKAAFTTLKHVASVVFPAVSRYVKDFLKALKPAGPFVHNVLIPLFVAMAKGVGGAVVLSFKLLLQIVQIVAPALGKLGKVLKPLAPVLKPLGIALGLLLAPRIIGGLAGMGKLGGVFGLLLSPVKLLLWPIKSLLSPLLGFGGALFGRAGAIAGIKGFGSVISGSLGLFFGIAAGVYLLYKNVKQFRDIVKGATSWLPGNETPAGESQNKLNQIHRRSQTHRVNPSRATNNLLELINADLGSGSLVSDLRQQHLTASQMSWLRSYFSDPTQLRKAGSEGAALRTFLGMGPLGSHAWQPPGQTKTASMMMPVGRTTVIHNHVHLDGKEIHQSVARHERTLDEAS